MVGEKEDVNYATKKLFKQVVLVFVHTVVVRIVTLIP